ncbi:MAG TPA: ATP-binding protein [Streptosporangiaceae bacterium]|nr:ATP-binding protein [Streptosporangiaceae bacterium]
MTADQHRSSGFRAGHGNTAGLSWHWHTALPSDHRAAEGGRQVTRAALAAWRLDHLSDTAVLLVSELVTNAVRHARAGESPIALHLETRAGWLRIEVCDCDPRWPEPRVPEELDESGFGLVLVDSLAWKWGVCDTATGKAVWAELAVVSAG